MSDHLGVDLLTMGVITTDVLPASVIQYDRIAALEFFLSEFVGAECEVDGRFRDAPVKDCQTRQPR